MTTEFYEKRDAYLRLITEADEAIERAYKTEDMDALTAAENSADELWDEYMDFMRRR